MSTTAARRYGASQLAFFLVVIFSALITQVSCVPIAGTDITVLSGQSIQAAINAAHTGDRIHVAAGTFVEQLTIKTDGISLIGTGGATILTKPSAPVANSCSGVSGAGSQAGICIEGDGIVLDPSSTGNHQRVTSVTTFVKGVSVTGFQVQGFDGNVVVIGGQDTTIMLNQLINGSKFGLLSVGSLNTKGANNTVSASAFSLTGMCMDDKADTIFSGNAISGYFTGISIQTTGGQAVSNTIKNCCIGAIIESGVSSAKVLQNQIGPLPATCAPTGVGVGIVINGAKLASVIENVVMNEANGGKATGMNVQDDNSVSPPAVASDNVIISNILLHNDLDIFVGTTAANQFLFNLCSTPKKYCSII